MSTAGRNRRLDRLLGAAILFVLTLVVIELALQWRAHLRWGQSIFDAVSEGEARYARHPETGLLLLRPNLVIASQKQVIRTNSLGLRSPEPIVPKPRDGLRIAVLGASSVFGAYASDNSRTFSQILAKQLQDVYPGNTIEVINAGVVGLALAEQHTMLSKIVLPLKPDWVVLYSGTNDFVRYCRKEGKQGAGYQPLWRPNLTSRLLTYELLTKNTVGLCKGFAPLGGEIDPNGVDLEPVENTLRDFVRTAQAAGAHVLLATNARSFRPEQPLALQHELAATALYYNYCFSLPGLHRMHERVNSVIEAVAKRTGAGLVRIDRLLPGGSRYFADANHFSAVGEQAVADIFFSRMAPELAGQGFVMVATR